MPGLITVGCKLPHGLLLQLQKPETRQEPVMGGGFKEVTRYERHGKAVKVNGYAYHRDNPKIKPPLLADPFCALTPDVDADFFNEWMAQNKEHPAVEGKFIFSRQKPEDATREAKNLEKQRNGLEPFDPENPVPEFRRKIETRKD